MCVDPPQKMTNYIRKIYISTCDTNNMLPNTGKAFPVPNTSLFQYKATSPRAGIQGAQWQTPRVSSFPVHGPYNNHTAQVGNTGRTPGWLLVPIPTIQPDCQVPVTMLSTHIISFNLPTALEGEGVALPSFQRQGMQSVERLKGLPKITKSATTQPAFQPSSVHLKTFF